MSSLLIDSPARLAWSWCGRLVAKATVLLLAGLGDCGPPARASAALRHRLWSLALCGIVILPSSAGLSLSGDSRFCRPASRGQAGSRSADGKARFFEGAPHSGSIAAKRHPSGLTHWPGRRRRCRTLQSPVESQSQARSVSGPIAAVWGLGTPQRPPCRPCVGIARNEWRRRSLAARRRPGVDGDLLGGALAAARPRSVGRAENRRQPVDPGHLGRRAAGRALARVLSRGWPAPTRRLVLLHELGARQAVRRAVPAGGPAGGRRLLVPPCWPGSLLHRLRVECELRLRRLA